MGMEILGEHVAMTTRILETMQETSGRKLKLELLSSWEDMPAINTILRQYLLLSLDPYRTYGVRVETSMIPKARKSTHDKFWVMLKKVLKRLAKRELTGNEARQTVTKLLSFACPKVQPWVVALINKEPRLGVQAATVNQVWPGLIPEFGCQLAEKSEDVKGLEKLVEEGEYWVEPKYDGLRILMVCDPDRPQNLTRNGHEYADVPWARIISKIIRDNDMPAVVVDAEAYKQDWKSSMSLQSGNIGKAEGFDVMCFDCLPLEDFRNGGSTKTQIFRRKMLNRLMATVEDRFDAKGKPCPFKVTAARRVENMTEAWEYAESFRQRGLEGGILKDARSPYVLKRSKAWVKLVVKHRGDYQVVGVEEGRGKYEGTCGALVLLVDGKQTKCGTGMDDKIRAKFWRHRKKLIGRIVEVEFREKTPDGKLRFPSFMRLRPDKE